MPKNHSQTVKKNFKMITKFFYFHTLKEKNFAILRALARDFVSPPAIAAFVSSKQFSFLSTFV